MTMTISRRRFLQLSASFGLLAGLGKLDLARAAAQDYKALVCLFMLGGNDGHNLLVSRDSTQYAAYQNARGSLALPSGQLVDILDPTLGAMGLHYGLQDLQPLFTQGKLAILANVGVLVQPTRYNNLSNSNFPLPINLRSHSDQVGLMQTGIPNAVGSSGWGGRTLDQLTSYNSGSSFPVSIAMNSPAIFCIGGVTQGVSLQPGNYLDQSGLNAWPAAAAQAKALAQQQIISADSGNYIVNAANRVMTSATSLNPLLRAASTGVQFSSDFGSSQIGTQLKEIARIISLNSQLNVGRQVFFCSLGGFDTHSGQSWQQWNLLQQVGKALAGFHSTMTSWGCANQVTTFTLSDFGRTLQPSGTGSDHGWGSHHLVLGGAVNGGKIYGRFPLMTNYKNFNTFADDYADTRGTMLPSTALVQYGATLAKWFGASDAQLNSIFPALANFTTRDLGFMA